MNRPIALLALSCLLLPGCVAALVAGGVAVGAGVVASTSEDTAEVDLKASREAVYQAALDRVEEEGDITSARAERFKFEGEIGNSWVEVEVFKAGEYTRLRVRARKLADTLPDLSLAEDIARDITRQF